MSSIVFKNVSFYDKEKSIINDVSIDVNNGDFIAVVGPSGGGKSTLLKLCSNLITPTGGHIYFNNKDIMEYNPTDLRKRVSYCFQTPHLFGNTVADNLEFPYTIRNEKLDIKRAYELFDMFSMSKSLFDSKVQNLSGGERQRIALIRSLMIEPEVLLLDEVTSALDSENTAIVEGVINTLNKKGITILMVTHNEEQSKRNVNKILTVESGRIKSLEVI